MKKTNLNGQVLSEKEMREVKGGYVQNGKDPANWKYCPQCGCPYGDTEEEKVFYDEHTELYGRRCLNCGGIIKV